MKSLKKRYKVLIGLMLAVTTVLIGIHIRIGIRFLQHDPLLDIQALSFKDMVFLSTLMFLPVYLVVLFFWWVGVNTVDARKKDK